MHILTALLLCFIAVFCSGCTLLGTESDNVAKYAGKTVKGYCENTTPDVRDVIREKVNIAAAPHSVAVTCANGVPPLTPDAPSGPNGTMPSPTP